MLKQPLMQRAARALAIVAMLGFGLAMAQSEPTMNQVYEAAQAGRLEQAQVMIQQVLVAHPRSAKAHFVQAELAARQGQAARAREALATAEKLAPGLPFAKPEAVQALRSQLAARSAPVAGSGATTWGASPAAPVAAASAFPWGLALLVGGGVIAAGFFLLRRKAAPAPMVPTGYADPGALPQGGLVGPQGFGMGGAGAAPAYGQPAAGSGLGGRVMGGLATGLAVGAGVMAAQAIGKSLMGSEEHATRHPDNLAGNHYEPLPGNNDLGGQNFGVNDASSWDDGSATASGGDGGDWDT